MSRYLKLLAVVLCFVVVVACTDNEPEQEEQSQVDDDTEQEENVEEEEKNEDDDGEQEDGSGGFLWKVENGDTTVYLQGTIHIGPEDMYPLHTKIEEAYEESDIVVPEIDLINVDQAEAQSLYQQYGTYQDGTTLQDHISQDLYQSVEEVADGYMMVDMETLNMFKPWYVSNLLQQFKVMELEYESGVDMYFLDRAVSDGKEIKDLETVEEQLQVLSGASEEYQITMLEEMLVSDEQYEEDLEEMLALWQEGDEDALLDELIVESDEEDAEAEAFLEAMNDERNYKMADQIMEFLEEDSSDTYFVIVGSMHLLLEPHIGSILEENGYEVERVH
ncbi:TraB/GumN family protein [Aquisalibacillus elongatus]|uniref:TraB family protein n=1 Tax=Aquisalibacillus elongatus TaxID=485577 RepID=A0A3N5BMY3_9BACI|nr:TraB/GumN family protein [Aquisalibacillus elongatus]RPF51058.1 hypothetical protein EDC24_2320 [Aquisalibacillus elongatus]